MTTDGLGKYLYVTEAISTHQGINLTAYSIASDGTLTVVPGSPFPYPMWAVQGDPSGKFLIGTSGRTIATSGVDDKNLYVFNIQQSGANAGAISPVSGSPFPTTYAPFNIAVQPNGSTGQFVYSFSVDSSGLAYNPVEGYALSSSGTLTAITGSPFSGVANSLWGQFDPAGNYLFFYGDAAGPEIGQYNVTPATGGLSQTTAPLPLSSTGYWAVSDVP